MKKAQAWWIAGALALLALLILMLGPQRGERPSPGADRQLPGLSTTTTLFQPLRAAPKAESQEDPDAFPGADALLRKTQQRVVARLGRYNDHEDLGYRQGVRLEKIIYYDKLYGARELTIHFENGLSRKLVAHFLEYKQFSPEDAFSAVGVPFPDNPALRQERYTADKRFYLWENYSGFKRIEIAAQKEGDRYDLLYISLEK
ncbi:hypothetical protein ACFL37_02085 [Candidatus Margulisiibacteriota bacterium]